MGAVNLEHVKLQMISQVLARSEQTFRSKMLLAIIFWVFCCLKLGHYLLKIYSRKNSQGRSKPTAQLNFMQLVLIALKVSFNSSVPNYELAKSFSETYGRFFYGVFPLKLTVLANVADLEISKRIMSSSAWSNRFPSDYYLYKWPFTKPIGLLFGNGGYWKEARKLTMKLLHQMDFYRQDNLEKFINFELKDLEDEMLQAVKDGGGTATFTMNHKFEVYTLNIVYQVMLGKRFHRDDPVAKNMMAVLNAGNPDFNLGTSILDIFPWLVRIPFVKIMKGVTNVNNYFHDYLKRELLDPKRKAKTYEKNPIDFVDYFLREIDHRADESPRYLTDENLLASLRDLIMGGADTTNTALEHLILHVSLNQGIQGKVQDEINQIIGMRQPIYDDRLSMPYTQAVLQEILRISTPVPLTARCPLTDNEINGHPIPKESLMAINLYAIHRDPALWKNPEEFQPEKFLNANNELINLDQMIPFGWGKRVCVGETVARISLFLFFVMLMQKFSFEISKDHPPPSMENQIGLSRSPSEYYVTVKCRNSK